MGTKMPKKENILHRCESLLKELQEYIDGSAPFVLSESNDLIEQVDSIRKSVLDKTITEKMWNSYRTCPVCRGFCDRTDVRRYYLRSKWTAHMENFHRPNFQSMDELWTEFLCYEEEQYVDGQIGFFHKRNTEKLDGKYCDECRESVQRERFPKHLNTENHMKNVEVYKLGREARYESQETFMNELVDIFVENGVKLVKYTPLRSFLEKYCGRVLVHEDAFRKLVYGALEKLPENDKKRIQSKLFIRGERAQKKTKPRKRNANKELEIDLENQQIIELTPHEKMVRKAEATYLARTQKEGGNREDSKNTSARKKIKVSKATSQKKKIDDDIMDTE